MEEGFAEYTRILYLERQGYFESSTEIPDMYMMLNSKKEQQGFYIGAAGYALNLLCKQNQGLWDTLCTSRKESNGTKIISDYMNIMWPGLYDVLIKTPNTAQGFIAGLRAVKKALR